MWMQVAVAIESMALIGVLGVLLTRRTHTAFIAGFNTMAVVTGMFAWYYSWTPRTVVVVAMVGVYLLRMNWVLLVWTGQTALSKLDEHTRPRQMVLLPLVLANTVGWAYCLPLYFAVRSAEPLGAADSVAVGIYVLGTVLHFGSDYQKRRFKRRAQAGQQLLDRGFWALCRHPNYLGDFLIYVSFAVVGGSIWGWIGPLLNLAQYAFDAIPKNEKWAAQRYGSAWEEYKAHTRSFIPYVL
jgi:protein-S-isoprenylcysteine O-methyltransferase Ste14